MVALWWAASCPHYNSPKTARTPISRALTSVDLLWHVALQLLIIQYTYIILFIYFYPFSHHNSTHINYKSLQFFNFQHSCDDNQPKQNETRTRDLPQCSFVSDANFFKLVRISSPPHITNIQRSATVCTTPIKVLLCKSVYLLKAKFAVYRVSSRSNIGRTCKGAYNFPDL